MSKQGKSKREIPEDIQLRLEGLTRRAIKGLRESNVSTVSFEDRETGEVSVFVAVLVGPPAAQMDAAASQLVPGEARPFHVVVKG